MSLKEKLISHYVNVDLLEGHRMTPLRKFVDSLGLDHENLTRKQMRKWASTKRYRDYFALAKIKKIADAANVSESYILENYDFFISNFDVDLSSEYTITAEEALSFLSIVEAMRSKAPRVKAAKIFRYTKHQKRGSYQSLEQRKLGLKKKIASVLGSGGLVSDAPGQIIFSGGKGKHSKRALGSNRLLLKTKVRTPEGMRYHRKVVQVPQK
jgi:hypothetical protein